ncbi:MlaD family protein [Rubellicoccus peritrichatus]|uniref:MlaD family protein n=1 Tax=Rubellicoccus peritrichatus TaxID=3080537 RepID=A0AAQ3LIR8_9BACT|nr:MlaD family protein [Puniceicoccus sp. CR14]WOO42889.1 MlaD family protein [Puniceicoccus sp. CR14]
MSKKANPAYIGIFVIGAIVLGVVAIMIFGSGQLFKKTETFVLYFEDSINGLDVGAPVKFKGVRIGQVTKIQIRFNQDDASPHVPVFIEIDIDRLKNTLNVDVDLDNPDVLRVQVEELGLRARLQQASFVTGMLFVELDYYPQTAPVFYVQQEDVKTGKKEYLEIPTVASGLTEVIKKVSIMVDQISKIDFGAIGRRVNDILTRLDDGLEDIEFKKINDKTVAVLDDLEKLLSDPEMKSLAANLNATLADGRSLITNLDGQIDPLVQEINLTAETARQTLDEFRLLAESANTMLQPDSPVRFQLETALREFAGASRSIRVLADYLERNPSALLSGKGDGS